MTVYELLEKWEKDSNMKPMFGGKFTNKSGDEVYIKSVIYNDPAIIVFWNDGTKTTAVAHGGDTFDSEKGLLVATLKKVLGNEFVSRLLEDWGEPSSGKNTKTLSDLRHERKNKNGK